MEVLNDSMEELQSTLAGWYDAATAGPSAKHAGFYAPLITGRVCGVGCHLGLVNPPSGKTNVVVVATEPNTAAARAGLQSGDVVVSVDSRPIQGRLYIPDDVAALIRGREGTTVEIVIERSGGERVKHVLVRELLDVEAADVAEDAGNSLYLTEAAPSPEASPVKKGGAGDPVRSELGPWNMDGIARDWDWEGAAGYLSVPRQGQFTIEEI